MKQGFTLVEISVVLVILALLAGGVIAGSALIEQGRVRATIAQKERFDAGALAFRMKYEYLPGDARNPEQFGGVTRAKTDRRGDGNGLIQVGNANGAVDLIACQEKLLFWRDLGDTGFITERTDGTDGTASTCVPSSMTSVAEIGRYVPASKFNNGIFWTVTSQGNGLSTIESADPKRHYYDLIGIGSLNTQGVPNRQYHLSGLSPFATIPVAMAYAIDAKADDGMARTGRVRAINISNGPYPAIGNPSATCATGANYRLDSGGTTCFLRFDAGF